MKMKRLFADTQGENSTRAGEKLGFEVSQVITPIIKKYISMGYSLRDIEYILHSEVNCKCLEYIVGWNSKG